MYTANVSQLSDIFKYNFNVNLSYFHDTPLHGLGTMEMI